MGPTRYEMAINAPYIIKTLFYTIRLTRLKALKTSSGLFKQKISFTHFYYPAGIQSKSILVCLIYNKSLKNKS